MCSARHDRPGNRSDFNCQDYDTSYEQELQKSLKARLGHTFGSPECYVGVEPLRCLRYSAFQVRGYDVGHICDMIMEDIGPIVYAYADTLDKDYEVAGVTACLTYSSNGGVMVNPRVQIRRKDCPGKRVFTGERTKPGHTVQAVNNGCGCRVPAGEATKVAEQSGPDPKKGEVHMSSPWNTYVRKVKCLFKDDPDISISYNEENYDLRLCVNGVAKADALCKLLPATRVFGGVTLRISVWPSNNVRDIGELIKTAFAGNPLFKDATTVTPAGCSNAWTYAVFSPERMAVQYWNDNLSNIRGITTELVENIANDVLDLPLGVTCCTDAGEDVVR